MELELSSGFMAGEMGIAHKPEMGLKAGRGEGLTQASDTAGNAPSLGIPVRAFKAEDVKLHNVVLLRYFHHDVMHGGSRPFHSCSPLRQCQSSPAQVLDASKMLCMRASSRALNSASDC
jgi:hypothetical protein